MKMNRNLLGAILMGTVLATGCSHLGDKSTGATIDDAAIAAKVKTKFAADSTVKARDIKVNVYQGIVQLSGFANSRAEAVRAEEIARDTAGVRSVKNDIRMAQAQ